MNKTNLQRISEQYIERFDIFNNESYQEYYKWQVCHSFPILMDLALEAPAESFPAAL